MRARFAPLGDGDLPDAGDARRRWEAMITPAREIDELSSVELRCDDPFFPTASTHLPTGPRYAIIFIRSIGLRTLSPHRHPDTIFTGGRVLTFDDASSVGEAIAITGDL